MIKTTNRPTLVTSSNCISRDIVLSIVLLLFLSGCSQQDKDQNRQYLNPDYWKRQALKDVAQPWNNNGIDTTYGAFHTFMKRDWQPYRSNNKYPGMVSRQVFSYAVAYMFSGKRKHLNLARRTMNYMIEHGWDEKYGGWYNAIDSTGTPVDKKKDLFMQTYAATGLAMYYIVTHDSTALHYLQRTNQLLEKHAWDAENGGYYRLLNRDLSVANHEKDFSPQLAPLSGHLLYLYAATRDTKWLDQARRIMSTALQEMRAGPQNWVMEHFNRDWTFLEDHRANRAANVGHNIEASWLALRLFDLTKDVELKKTALTLADTLEEYGMNVSDGIWFHRINFDEPRKHPDTSPWWVQAYGNMHQLYLYRTTGNRHYLNNFKRGADFWSRHFMDERYGGAVLSVTLDGEIDKGEKAVRTKTAYHSMEHALLNYIYLNMWVKNTPFKLNYHIKNPGKDEKLYPLLLEDYSYQITSVKLNGEAWTKINQEKGYIRLPDTETAKITVKLKDR